MVNAGAEALICQQKGLLTLDNQLTDKALGIIQETEALFKKVKAKVSSELMGEDYMEKVRAYHEMFPKGKNPFSNYRYRTNVRELADKFAWFFQNYPEYTNWDLVLNATEIYLYEKQQEKHRYTAIDSNFIRRTDAHKTVRSDLASYCERIISGEYAEELQQHVRSDMYKVRAPSAPTNNP